MKLSIKAMTLAGAAVWGGSMLLAGLANLKSPGYGDPFLRTMASLYPGYHASPKVIDVLVGAAYGAADGAMFGALCGIIYNQVVACEK